MLVVRSLALRGLPLTRPPVWLRASGRSLSLGMIPGTPKKLDDVIKLETVEQVQAAQVSAIWETYHEDRPGVAGAAVQVDEYNLIAKRASESPMFVHPVFRGDGYFMLVSQFDPRTSMFALANLEDYRRNAALAPPWMSVLMFNDLLTSKGLGLLRAEAESERLTKAEVERLLAQVRRFHASDEYDRVYTFNHAERHFDINAYVASCKPPAG